MAPVSLLSAYMRTHILICRMLRITSPEPLEVCAPRLCSRSLHGKTMQRGRLRKRGRRITARSLGESPGISGESQGVHWASPGGLCDIPMSPAASSGKPGGSLAIPELEVPKARSLPVIEECFVFRTRTSSNVTKCKHSEKQRCRNRLPINYVDSNVIFA